MKTANAIGGKAKRHLKIILHGALGLGELCLTHSQAGKFHVRRIKTAAVRKQGAIALLSYPGNNLLNRCATRHFLGAFFVKPFDNTV